MGIYLIAAGKSSENRQKTLEKAWSLNQISGYVPSEVIEKLKSCFPDGSGIYAWGANAEAELSEIRSGEYVVDVKNKEIVQIFQFCFWYKSSHTRLQELFGWDEEKPYEKRRPYRYVYFLNNPASTLRRDKSFLARAFALEGNPQWLVRQRYISDQDVQNALLRTKTNTVHELLGITASGSSPILSKQNTVRISEPPVSSSPEIETSPDNTKLSTRPIWLVPVIEMVEALIDDAHHLERDHEDIVASFFEVLGYRRVVDIKFRRGNIDIRIDRDGEPFFTIEVKADWSLTCKSTAVINQAYAYANEIGTRYVIITNCDRYCLFDRTAGLKYEDQLVGSFKLSALSEKDLAIIEVLRNRSI
jgi:hypothetical protein